MKVYVDELPKKCLKCPCFNQCGYMCQINKKLLDTAGKGSADNSRDEDCPLQPLSDYTKQVKKEVCDKIYKILEHVVPHNLYWTWSIINKELNIMRGETK